MRLVLAGLMLVLAAGAVGEPRRDPVSLSVWAACASKEGRETKHFDAAVKPIADAVGDLPFDTYHSVKTAKQTANIGVKAKFPIDAKYTLYITPVAHTSDKRIRLELLVEMAPKKKGDKPVKALSTRVLAKPRQKLKLHGIQAEKGELVIVLMAE